MGMTLREVIFDIAGGIRDGKEFKAVQMGGPSGGCIPAHLLDTIIDYKALGATGACVGRPLMQPLREKGPEGVRETIAAITGDLRYAMAMTASPDVQSVDPSIVRLAKHTW